jgi:hypothetical protein
MEAQAFNLKKKELVKLTRIAVLLNMYEEGENPIIWALNTCIDYTLGVAEQTKIHGKAEAFLHPALLEAINNNPRFFDRLAAEPELIEWLEPFVATNPPKQELT